MRISNQPLTQRQAIDKQNQLTRTLIVRTAAKLKKLLPVATRMFRDAGAPRAALWPQCPGSCPGRQCGSCGGSCQLPIG